MANKKALLMVHFGTTHDDTRELTINKMNKKFSKKFTDYDFYEAYTSRIILKKLKDRDFLKDNPIKALEKIVANGYKELIVQSSHVILGIEYDNVVEEINLFKDQFESIKIGKPLLSTLEDYKKIAETLIKYYVPKEKKHALVLVCHGTDSPMGAAYPMLEYIFNDMDHENVFVVSTKTYPLMENLLKKLKKNGIKEVSLAPFMFVAGEHAKNDMAIDYKEELEENGFIIKDIFLKGLGEFDEIQDIFLEHLEKELNEKEENIAEFKKKYTEKYL